MTAEPNTSMTTDQALAIVDAATEWADGSGVVSRYEETRAAVSVLTQEIERLTTRADQLLDLLYRSEHLWNARMLGASVVIPRRDDPDPLTQVWYEIQDELAGGPA